MIRSNHGGLSLLGVVMTVMLLTVVAVTTSAVQDSPPTPTPRPGSTVESVLANSYQVTVAAGSFSRGEPDAQITVVAFMELLCPFCARVTPELERLMRKYDGRIRLVFQSYIVHGDRARKLHRLAYAAGRQGKFWEVEAIIMGNMASWNTDDAAHIDAMIAKLVQDIGLDAERLRRDMDSPEVAQQIDQEVALAKQLSLTGVPTLFINGHKTVGSREFEFIDEVVTRLLSGGKR